MKKNDMTDQPDLPVDPLARDFEIFRHSIRSDSDLSPAELAGMTAATNIAEMLITSIIRFCDTNADRR